MRAERPRGFVCFFVGLAARGGFGGVFFVGLAARRGFFVCFFAEAFPRNWVGAARPHTRAYSFWKE